MVEQQAKLSPSGCEARRKGTPARAQSSAVTGNDDFRLDEGPGFRGKSDRQIKTFPAPGRTEPRPIKAGFVFLGSRSPSRVANHCDSTAFRARCRRLSTSAAKRSPGRACPGAWLCPERQRYAVTDGPLNRETGPCAAPV